MGEQSGGCVMAFDFGLRHIGVALGLHLTATARGIATLSAKSGKPRWQELQALLDEYQPGHLLVGLPLNMDGSESDMAAQARRFAAQLGHRSGLPVTLHDERLSTRQARAEMERAKAMGPASSEHELAACLILTSWFSEAGAGT